MISSQQNTSAAPASPAPHENSNRIYLIAGAALVIGGLLLAGWYMLREPFSDPFAELKGNLHITAAKAGDNAADIYALDVVTGQMSALRPPGYVRYTSKVSPQGEYVAYLGEPLNRESGFAVPYSTALDLVVQNRDGNDAHVVYTPRLASTRLPSWSPDSMRIALTGVNSGGSFKNLNDWRIEIATLDISGSLATSTILGQGSYPLWSPDGKKILSLQRDGLYTYRVSDGKTEKVADSPDLVGTINTHLGLSSDGSLLGWTQPGMNRLRVYKISSWSPFAFDLLAEFIEPNMGIYWPVFSPDNRYVAVEHIARNASGSPMNNAVIVYDLETLEKKYLADLNAYDADITFITDWR